MQGKEASACAGCWRLTLLSCVLALLHLIPPSVHGGVAGTNATEPETTVNITSPIAEDQGPDKAAEVITVVTGMAGAATSAPLGAVTPRAGRVPRAGEEEEEQGSGVFGETLFPAAGGASVASPPPPPQLSPDSAETEHLLPGNPRKPEAEEGEEEEEEVEEEGEEEKRLPRTDPPWIRAEDTSVFDLDRLFTTTPPAPPAAAAANPSNPDVLHVDFFDPSSRGRDLDLDLDLDPPSPSSVAHELQGGDATSWAMPENYDYLTPYEDGVSPTADEYTYSTTTDAYESDDDLRNAAGPPARARPQVPGASYPDGAPNGPAAAPPAASPNGCRAGFSLVNGSCRSACDQQPNYCQNGGQCYQLDGVEIFCRCNVQDYIWHKGARCESVVTEFQVMCLAVGASALVVLLLFMIVVCFAKKLHVLKTENKKLRKRSSKYRPTSEQHNDNFSLSTIAEGSHPNKTMSRYTWECKTKEESDCEDDPNSQNKLEDPVKAPPKEDDSLNIHNSLTPKHENHKVLGEENSSEVTIDLELHLNKKIKFRPSGEPPAKYDIYLYRMPQTKPRVLNGPKAKPVNGPSRAKRRVLRWADDFYPPSPPCSVCSPVSTRSLPASVASEQQPPKRLTLSPHHL